MKVEMTMLNMAEAYAGYNPDCPALLGYVCLHNTRAARMSACMCAHSGIHLEVV